MEFILTLHGSVRWLVLIVAVLAVVRFALGWLRKLDYTPLDSRLMLIYTIALDFNLLLGLILLIGLGGGFPSNRIEHAGTMFLAVLLAHTNAAWRKSDDAQRKFRNNLVVVIVSLLVIFMGVIRLRGGWMWG